MLRIEYLFKHDYTSLVFVTGFEPGAFLIQTHVTLHHWLNPGYCCHHTTEYCNLSWAITLNVWNITK